MILKAFAVYDLKALNYGVPFFMPSVGGAVRAFADLANDSSSTVFKHPSDFQLYEIGEFDDSTSGLKALLPVRLLGLASDFVEKSRVPSLVREMVEKPLATTSEVLNGGQ